MKNMKGYNRFVSEDIKASLFYEMQTLTIFFSILFTYKLNW